MLPEPRQGFKSLGYPRSQISRSPSSHELPGRYQRDESSDSVIPSAPLPPDWPEPDEAEPEAGEIEPAPARNGEDDTHDDGSAGRPGDSESPAESARDPLPDPPAPRLAAPAVDEEPEAGLVDASAWPAPTALESKLDDISAVPVATAWADSVRRALSELRMLRELDDPRVSAALARLQIAGQLPLNIDQLSYSVRRELRSAAYDVERRIALWAEVHEAAKRLANIPLRESRPADSEQRIAAAVSETSAWLRHGQYGEQWETYFELPALQVLCDRIATRPEGKFRVIATSELPVPTADAASDSANQLVTADQQLGSMADIVLHRIYSDKLTRQQQAFIESTVVGELASSLKQRFSRDLSLSEFLADLESYEASPAQHTSFQLLRNIERMYWSPEQEALQGTMQILNSYYRNANFRLAVSADLINRLMPALHTYAEQVNDTILGAEVHGQNASWTSLSVALIPDSQRIRLKLQANGRVHSTTTSTKGPVTLYNQGQGSFQAYKQLLVQPDGIYATRTLAAAESGTRLIDLRSDLDNFPLLGWVVRLVATQQHDEQRSLLRNEIRRRIERSASSRMDREIQSRLAGVEQRVQRRVLQPLQELELNPRAMEMRTTEDRIMMRVRLAGPMQLAAHTARPLALGDSLLSLQLHESAVNNMVQKLEFDGQSMTLEQLLQQVADKLGLGPFDMQEVQNKDISIRFTSREPVRVNFDKNRILVTINIAEMRSKRRVWRDFSVRVFYRADVDDLKVEMVSDGTIELIGERLGIRDQLALRGIFTKVLLRNHRFQALENAIRQQPRLNTLTVTQFVVRDGWLGLALGDPSDREPLMTRRPSPDSTLR
jgi:hypothetical protein